ncbi:hypothetical protein Bca101_063309 [Brassica carinata]
MSAERRSMITVGGKGSSLSSSSVYKIASGVANVRIDSSAIERLSTRPLPLIKRSSFGIPEGLTNEEIRASLVVLLNKLLLSNSGSVRSVLPVKILEILNLKDETLDFGDVEVTEGENVVLEKSCASLVGICSVIDHKSTVLSQIVDSVAALSCEATKADITSFSSLDSGDGFGNKDAISVAGDLKVLLNGSKAVGKVAEVEEVSKIPRIHGKFRDVVRSVHSDARVELNSGVIKGGGIGEALGATLSALCVPIKSLGECSFLRAKLCFESIGNEDLRKLLFESIFVDYEKLKSGIKLALVEEDPCRLAHKLNECLGIVWSIVGLEAAAAYFALSGGDKSGDADKEEPKSDKKKKKNEKRAVLGKGTSVLIQFIKERLVSSEEANGGVQVEKILDLYNPEGHGFDGLLAKVKEIVESNENRRLPKLPKVNLRIKVLARPRVYLFLICLIRLTGYSRFCSSKDDHPRKGIFNHIQNVFKKHGATALDTPVFELRETLMGKYGEDSKLIYDLADQVKLNHRKLLDGMLEICGVPAEKFRTICSSIDKLDKQSFEQVKKEMVEEKGLSSEIADRIGSFVKEKGAPIELLSKLRQEGSEFLGNSSAKEALDELSVMFEALERSKCSHRLVFDLSLARGLDYYTGVIFEAVCIGAEVGSIAAGGRYDNLIGMFGAKQVPAVGMSLGIERVFNILEKKQKLEKEQKRVVRPTETKVLVSIMEEDKLGEAAELVSQLWEADINAEYLVTKRNSKHFDWAKGSKIPWMVVVGKTELSEGVVTLKKMVEGSEEEFKGVPRDSFVAELLKCL